MMTEIFTYVQSRLASQKGQGIVEYALILAFVVVVAAAITNGGGLRDKIATVFQKVTEAFGTN